MRRIQIMDAGFNANNLLLWKRIIWDKKLPSRPTSSSSVSFPTYRFGMTWSRCHFNPVIRKPYCRAWGWSRGQFIVTFHSFWEYDITIIESGVHDNYRLHVFERIKVCPSKRAQLKWFRQPMQLLHCVDVESRVAGDHRAPLRKKHVVPQTSNLK